MGGLTEISSSVTRGDPTVTHARSIHAGAVAYAWAIERIMGVERFASCPIWNDLSVTQA